MHLEFDMCHKKWRIISIYENWATAREFPKPTSMHEYCDESEWSNIRVSMQVESCGFYHWKTGVILYKSVGIFNRLQYKEEVTGGYVFFVSMFYDYSVAESISTVYIVR